MNHKPNCNISIIEKADKCPNHEGMKLDGVQLEKPQKFSCCGNPICTCTESKCCEKCYDVCGNEWCRDKNCLCHKKEEIKHGKNLCSKYHPDDCCTENPKCAFYKPEHEKCSTCNPPQQEKCGCECHYPQAQPSTDYCKKYCKKKK